VWICSDPRGHIQATGRDQAGRKQYIYHSEWSEIQQQNKTARLLAFAKALPCLRAQVAADLRSRSLNRKKVIALVVRLLESTLIRIGNREYARQNNSYGLTTFLDDHVQVNGAEVLFEFQGKSGKEHEIALHDPRLAKLVQACQELPGQRLFQYLDGEGKTHAVESGDINEYLRTVTGSDFSAKEFRTWGGTVMAAKLLRNYGDPLCASEREGTHQINAVLKEVATGLGNTLAVCRQHYVHPVVVEAFRSGALQQYYRETAVHDQGDPYALDSDEAAVLSMLSAAQ
jgi:DNA topoisomerase-1